MLKTPVGEEGFVVLCVHASTQVPQCTHPLPGSSISSVTLTQDSGAPAVGDVVTSDDGEYLQNDGTTIVVKDGKIAEIKPAEKKDESAESAETATDPNAEEIDKLKKECQNLSKRLTEMENNAVSTIDIVTGKQIGRAHV